MPPTVEEPVMLLAARHTDPPSKIAGQLTAKDLEWAALPGAGSETQTVYLFTEDGAFFFIQLAHANAAFNVTVQVSYRYVNAKKNINIFETCSCSTSDFRLSPDRRSVSCSPISIQQSPEQDAYTVELRKSGRSITLRLQREIRGYKVGNGRVHYGPTHDAPYSAHRWWPRCTVTGTAMLDRQQYDLSGTGTFIHAGLNMKPHLAANTSNLVMFHSPRISFSLLEFKLPRSLNAIDLAHGSISVDGQLLSVALEHQLELLNLSHDKKVGYTVPTHIRITSRGYSIEDTPRLVEVTVDTPLTTLIGQVDVLGQLPWVIRVVIQALVTKPYVYQWESTTSVQVRIDGELLGDEGRILFERAFINEGL